MLRVTVFNEFRHEKLHELPRKLYPEGIHTVIADFLRGEDVAVTTVTLDTVEDGLSAEALARTDVLLWWGHIAHSEVPDEVALRVRDAVLMGMGAIFLHSAHHSKPFRLLMGTSCNLTWRAEGENEVLWVIDPSHPITAGIDRYLYLPGEEMYGEPFAIPEPDKLLLVGSFNTGEVIRAGCLWQRECGKVFYFQPGHETYPTYHREDVQRVLKNAVRFVAPTHRSEALACQRVAIIDERK